MNNSRHEVSVDLRQDRSSGGVEVEKVDIVKTHFENKMSGIC